ncbi:MAG: SDR family NAD(P)-dependent oxidoreductase [Phenylobacterium sp.]|uniref:SDR family NAD(P)-dependent oxidoreductase n=1 Tax=Phenylobacterium sp. TaxID=1871053 RepID=UPI002716192F|nr:SDR family NAD(P)-dependent oxidoreductase [Phenylobacterium sp.]MDO8900371.1 SDR family NAD(P)-dependent oxidoreductase [Phenylobacterium sp.]
MFADNTLAGKIALITGASGGLGAHFARVLAEAGAEVVLTARRLDLITAGADEINDAGGRAHARVLDVADADQIAPVFAEVGATIGPIDILINNAGVGGEGRALDLTPKAWDRAFDVNVRGVFFCAQAAARQMIAADLASRGGGRIVNIASIAAHTVLPGLSAYNASKAAVGMMTKSLAREWSRHQIAVNALCPGYVETDINRDWFATEGGQRQVAGFPRRRLMGATDLDAALLMLAGPAASAITGTLVTVDDGQSLP